MLAHGHNHGHEKSSCNNDRCGLQGMDDYGGMGGHFNKQGECICDGKSHDYVFKSQLGKFQELIGE